MKNTFISSIVKVRLDMCELNVGNIAFHAGRVDLLFGDNFDVPMANLSANRFFHTVTGFGKRGQPGHSVNPFGFLFVPKARLLSLYEHLPMS